VRRAYSFHAPGQAGAAFSRRAGGAACPGAGRLPPRPQWAGGSRATRLRRAGQTGTTRAHRREA